MTKLLVCGSRTITNSAWIFSEIEKYLAESNLHYSSISIIEGGARGVDKIAKQFADDKNIPVIEMPADWDSYGKAAGFIRNEQMVRLCDLCLILWDGKSHGTKNDIDLCDKYNKSNKIVIYKE